MPHDVTFTFDAPTLATLKENYFLPALKKTEALGLGYWLANWADVSQKWLGTIVILEEREREENGWGENG